MTCLAWNCQGLGNLWSQQFLSGLITRKKPSVVFLSETKCMKPVLEKLRRAWKYEGLLTVDPIGSSGGLALLWNNVGIVQLQTLSVNHIDVLISDRDSAYRVTGIYGESDRERRDITWQLIRDLAQYDNNPWFLIGDFNGITNQSEKKGGLNYPQHLIDAFRGAIQDCALLDIGMQGYEFTWTRGRLSEKRIESRLDRALVNRAWLLKFPEATVWNLGTGPSDHNPILLEFHPRSTRPRRARFRFEQAWTREPDCELIVRQTWTEAVNQHITSKLNLVCSALSQWSRNSLRHLDKKIDALQEELNSLQGRWDRAGSHNIRAIQLRLQKLMQQKDDMWRQRAKQHWLNQGDQNTKYFHAKASERKRLNNFKGLEDSQGQYQTWDSGLEGVIRDYYQDLFTTEGSDADAVLNCIPNIIRPEQNLALEKEVSDSEVWKAIKGMDPNKSPGPDGLGPGFYQHHWHIIGPDVTQLVRDFFQEGRLPPGINNTNIILIPKKSPPKNMGDLRPISLCNVIFKIISKVMANRLSKFMDAIISPSQSAFIKGRLITDNIMIAGEVVHFLKRTRKGKKEWMALKIDMSKAYDRVEWDYMSQIIHRMGFSEKWCSLVRRCMDTVEYTLVPEGRAIGPITPTRGIRQGDPLSPYLFILCTEGLSRLLHRFETQGRIHGCQVTGNAPSISHLFFADDSYIFCKATVQEATQIQECLYLFERASGQRVNTAKSSIFFSANSKALTVQTLCNMLDMPVGTGDATYLGLPVLIGRNKKGPLGFIKDRVLQRVQSWGGNLLSKAGN